MAENTWWAHISTTLSEIAASYLFTAVVGFLLAILICWSKFLRTVLMPIIAVLNSLPKIALAPLFLIWLGYGFAANVTIAIIVAFFPIVLNTTVGLDSVDEDLLDLVRYLNASKLQIFMKIRFRTRCLLFFRAQGERHDDGSGRYRREFVASSQGLGFLIKDSQAMMNTPPMFASLFIISGLGLGLFAFIGLLERLLMPWNRRKRGARREKDGFAPVPAQTPMVILVLLVIWELCVRIFKVKEYILPSPIVSLKHLFLAQPDANYNWLLHIRITLMEIALSFAVTSVLGIAIAIGIAWSSAIKKIVMPAFVFLNSLPVVAVAPLLVLWYGYGLKRYPHRFLVSFFPS